METWKPSRTPVNYAVEPNCKKEYNCRPVMET